VRGPGIGAQERIRASQHRKRLLERGLPDQIDDIGTRGGVDATAVIPLQPGGKDLYMGSHILGSEKSSVFSGIVPGRF
jgi:hypothetical protein